MVLVRVPGGPSRPITNGNTHESAGVPLHEEDEEAQETHTIYGLQLTYPVLVSKPLSLEGPHASGGHNCHPCIVLLGISLLQSGPEEMFYGHMRRVSTDIHALSLLELLYWS